MNATDLTPQELFSAAISLIRQELLPAAPAHRKPLLLKLAELLRLAQADLADDPPVAAAAPALSMAILPPGQRADLQAWGKDLRMRRQAAGLTKVELAAQIGTSATTILNLELGTHAPRRSVVMRLQAIPALGLPAPPGNLPFAAESDSPDGPAGELSCCCWFAPEYDAIQMIEDLVHKLNGTGGHIEQTFLYADPASAAAFCQVTAHDSIVRARSRLPINELASEILGLSQGMPVDLIGLGAGEAREEIRLMKAWVSQGYRQIRLLLLDSSQPLLCAGYRNAASALGEVTGVKVFALQGNFHNLPGYTPLFAPARRRRVACMFGETFAALENELSFVRNSLHCFAAGDLLILTMPLIAAPTESPDDILVTDQQLCDPPPDIAGPRAALYGLLTGPFKRYVRDLQSVSLTSALDFACCPVPGSYAVDWRVRVRRKSQPDCVFSLGGLGKRYDSAKLSACLLTEGWQVMKLWPSEEQKRLLLMCRKTERPS